MVAVTVRKTLMAAAAMLAKMVTGISPRPILTVVKNAPATFLAPSITKAATFILENVIANISSLVGIVISACCNTGD